MPRHKAFLDIGASAPFPRAADQHADRLLKLEHPHVRVTEADIDTQVRAVFDKMRVQDEKVRQWFCLVLASQTRDAQAESLAQRAELQRQKTLPVHRQDRLLNMRFAQYVCSCGRARTFARSQAPMASIGRIQIEARPGRRFADLCHAVGTKRDR